MDKIWLKSYPPGIPAEIPPLEYASIAEFFLHASKTFHDLPAAENMGKTLSYRELEELAKQFAAFLKHDLGLQKGQKLAIMMPNLLQYLVALYGAFLAGLTVVNVNPLYTPRELAHQMNDSETDAIIILANMAYTLEKALKSCTTIKHIVVTQVGDLLNAPKGLLINFALKYLIKPYPKFNLPDAIAFKDAMALGNRHTFKPVESSLDDIAFLQYTGGTTGVAKGAMLTHRNMLSNVAQGGAWISQTLEMRKEVIVTALPLYHIFSLTANCLMFTEMGALNVLITNPRDIKGFVKTLGKFPFTVLTGVNTLFNGLLHNPNFAKLDFSHLKISLGGGMAVQHSVAERWKEVTGKPLLEAYGLTETSPAATMNPFTLNEYTGAIGLPLPSTEVKIVDEAGRELDISEVGELCIRGPQVMKGYWKREDETRDVLDEDGWLRTGDMAKIDAKGFIYIVDRKKDMILVSGFNVYPNEVENAVMEHPGVLEAAAIGKNNPESGQVVKLFVVRKDPNLTEKEIIDFCRESLTRYKVPKEIEFRDELPKTNVGKILRRELRD